MPRPQITFISQKVLNRKNDPSSPAEPVLTTSVNVTMPQAQLAAEAEAVLIALGSHTHAFDMNQRYVQLENTTVDPLPSNTFTLTLEAPEYRWAPPGYYMLFVLDKNDIPSTSVMVRLE